LVQEQAFYPFGLQMAAISSKAILKTTDPYKYNAGSELEEELNYYNTFYRKYDAQIGRFTGVDIRSEESAGMSVYNFAANNPVMFNDPMGDKFGRGNQMEQHPIDANWSYGTNQGEGNGFGGLGDSGGGGGYSFDNGKALAIFSGLLNALNVFDLGSLSQKEAAKFNDFIFDIISVPAGLNLLNNLNTCGETIVVSNEMPNNSEAAASYSPLTNILKTGDLLSDTDFAIETGINAIAHELFHAYQDFNGITSSPAKEVDAYLYTSLIQRQYGMSDKFYNEIVITNSPNVSQASFYNAWSNFFKNGYSYSDYKNVYKYFIEGSKYGNEYSKNGRITNLNPKDGGYLFYTLIK